MREVRINTERIKLDSFLKWAAIAETGGDAKALIQSGYVAVNGVTENRRGRQLQPGDVVTVKGQGEFLVSR